MPFYAGLNFEHIHDGTNQDRKVLFGEQHMHTRNSFDAFTIGVRTTWEDAYRYGMGEEITHPTNGKKIQRPGRRRIQDRAADIECRGMAGTGKTRFVGAPRHAAPEMRALAMQREKTAILETREVEIGLGERRHGAAREPADGPHIEHTGLVVGHRAAAGTESAHGDPGRLQARHDAEAREQAGEELTAYGI